MCIYFNRCAENIALESQNYFEACDYTVVNPNIINSETIDFGTDSTLDIITWNIEHFPKENSLTVNYLAALIDTIDVDIIAMQEIMDATYFNNLVNIFDGWEGSRNDEYYGLAFLYKSTLTVDSIGMIEELDNYNFARTPFMLVINWGGEGLYIINNHYKCCGNGAIEDIQDDEEYRRLQAIRLTRDYLNSHLENKNIILLGDFNDLLSDERSNNVFWEFISDSNNYRFLDLQIACGSNDYWSYPDWGSQGSHLDHILISNELFDDYENNGSLIQTILLGKYFEGGWDDYNNYISDHLPVGLRLVFNP